MWARGAGHRGRDHGEVASMFEGSTRTYVIALIQGLTVNIQRACLVCEKLTNIPT